VNQDFNKHVFCGEGQTNLRMKKSFGKFLHIEKQTSKPSEPTTVRKSKLECVVDCTTSFT